MDISFQPGQRLTAEGLNEAFRGVEGPMNPSDDYKWTKTGVGRLNSQWDVFMQSRNMNPMPLEVTIGYSEVGGESVHEIGGKKPSALRRVFMNVGRFSYVYRVEGRTFLNCPSLGEMNGMPLIGVIGLSFHDPADKYMTGDGDLHFSIWSPSMSDGGGDASAPWWTLNQRLWQDDTARGCDSRGWWWTGITLERHLPGEFDQDVVAQGLDLVCFPVNVQYVAQGSGDEKTEDTYTFLCVMLRWDMVNLAYADVELQSRIVEQLNQHVPVDGMEAKTLQFVFKPGVTKTLAQYIYREGVQNAYFQTMENYVTFEEDSSPMHLAGYAWRGVPFSARNPVAYNLQWIDGEGRHRGAGSRQLEVTKMDGSRMGATDVLRHYAVACAFNPEWDEPVLSAVAYENAEMEMAGDSPQYILSGLFNDVDPELSSGTRKRLVFLGNLNSWGVEYWDTCPDFSDSAETPDSSLSVSLSSLQRKRIENASGEEGLSSEAWSLWQFDDFDNSKTMDQIQDDLSSYDMVVRHVTTSGETAKGAVEYVHLSSLSLSGETVPADGDSDAAGLSSLETRELDGGEKVLQLFKFDDPSTIDLYLSAQDRYDFVVRDNEDGRVRYANLSGMDMDVALSGTDDSSWKGKEFRFSSMSDSNVSVHVDAREIRVGVYYL